MSVLSAILVLGGIGAVGAVTLNRVAKRFKVHEDPLVAEVEKLLPGANCGGCGMKGCHDFAVQCVKAGNLDGYYCPSAGKDGMQKISVVMGCNAVEKMPMIAVKLCEGTSTTKTPFAARYIGPHKCTIMNMTAGDYQCTNSCLGCGDCVDACPFDAITRLPDHGTVGFDAQKCTGCGKCVTICPRHIIELRPRGVRERRVWVACSSCQKGAITRKQCSVGCIACGKCVKTCPFDAISIEDNHAYIDPAKCRTCGKCISVCPTGAILSHNVKVKPKVEEV